MNKSKLSIGTAQFIDNYGLKKNTKLNKNKIFEIYDFCNLNNINKLDTAVAYKDAEKVLGLLDLKDWEITTKLNKIPSNVSIKKYINTQIELSLKNLNIDCLDNLLLHRPEQLFSPIGNQIYDALMNLIYQKKISNFGYSVYSPQEFKDIYTRFKCNVCQIPFNIFDQRILESNFQNLIIKNKIKLQTRSIFLQGLLLLKKDEIHKYFYLWNKHFNKYFDFLKLNKTRALDLCVNFSYTSLFSDTIIVGIQNLDQLKQILKVKNINIKNLSSLKNSDINLIDPTKWKIV